MQQYQDHVTDQYGNAQRGASVLVKTAAGATATIYSDDGVTAKDNPITTGASGAFDFYAANGSYVLNIDGVDSTRFTLLDVTEASTATPTPSSTVVGETGGVVKRFAKDSLGPFVNVKDPAYGAVGDGVTNDTTAIQAAIDSLSSSLGTVFFPRGRYVVTGLTVPAGVYLAGEGERSSKLLYAGTGNAVLLGGTSASLYYHLGIKGFSIILSNVAGTAVLAKGTAGAKIHDLYVEGPLTYPRTTRGVVLDGGNASSFFNDVRNVLGNHIHTGFEITSTGSQVSTQQVFTNCSNFGDVTDDATSTCLTVDTGNGHASVWTAGNAEFCGKGFHYETGASSMSVYGARFEGNTLDLVFDAACLPQSFFGLVQLSSAKIQDNSGAGYDRHTFVGCTDSNAAADPKSPYNVWPGTNKFKSLGANVTPVRVTGHASQAIDAVLNETSAAVRTSGVGSDMNYFGNHFQFPATQVPSSNANALDDYAEGSWTPVVGGSGGESGQTYVHQKGKYTKIGNQVTVTADVYLSAKGTITGDVRIKGLPFACNGTVGSAMLIGYASLTTAVVSVSAYIPESGSHANLGIRTAAATTPTIAVAADIANSTQIVLSATYFV